MVAKHKTRTNTALRLATRTITQTKPNTTQAISIQQSQALAQTFVHASFSAIAFLRDLFPEACFVQKSGDELLNLKDYDDYMKTAQRLASKSTRAPGRACFETLVRGELELVDKLLDQIQKGAFYALQMKVLKAMVIGIGLDKDRPQHVLEAYTYTFSYRTSLDGLTVLDDITLKGSTDAITFDKAKYSLNGLVRQANYECKNKPHLPPQRYITVRLIYNDDWDATLNIPGFRTDEAGIGLGEAIGWQRAVQDSRKPVLDAGYHGVSLAISLLQPEEESGIPDDMFALLPNNQELTYPKISRTSIPDESLDERLDRGRVANSAKNAAEKNGENLESHIPSGTASAAANESSQVSTQTREDIATRRQLDAILNAPSVVANGGDTQMLSGSAIVSQPPMLTSNAQRVVFSADTLEELDEVIQYTGPLGRVGGDEAIVDCECGCNDDKDAVRSCHFCKRDQHIICYGYLGPDDPRLPADQVCYKCLLHSEGRLLEDMKDLAILRKGAMGFMGGTCGNGRQLAEHIRCDLQTAKHVAEKLLSEGYLRRGKKRGQPSLELKATERQRLVEIFFEPTFKITHHLALPAISQMPNTAMTTQFTMPPPTAPTTYPETPGRSLQVKRVAGDSIFARETPITKRRKTRMEIGETLNALREREERLETPVPDSYE